MEFHHIVPQDGDMDGEVEGNEEHPSFPDLPIWSEVLIIPYAFITKCFVLMCPNPKIYYYIPCYRQIDSSFELGIL